MPRTAPLTPTNHDRDSADMTSLGRSVTSAAWTNSRCCGVGFAGVISATATSAIGLATATAATALMAVESLRRRRLGTEVSSICGVRLELAC